MVFVGFTLTHVAQAQQHHMIYSVQLDNEGFYSLPLPLRTISVVPAPEIS